MSFEWKREGGGGGVWFNSAVTCRDYIVSVLDEWVSAEHWWSDSDRVKAKHCEPSLSHCHFANHKLQMDWPGIESGPQWWVAWEMERYRYWIVCVCARARVCKCKVLTTAGHEGPEGEWRYSFTLSLTSALDGGGWLTPRPCFPREWCCTHYKGGWVGPMTDVDGCVKSILHRDSIPGPSSPLGSRYTDWAIAAGVCVTLTFHDNRL